MKKRFRKPEAKPGEILAKYGQEYGEKDLFYCWPPNDAGMKSDTHLLMTAIERVKIHDDKSLRQLLEERGYDITTFKLTVRKIEPRP